MCWCVTAVLCAVSLIPRVHSLVQQRSDPHARRFVDNKLKLAGVQHPNGTIDLDGVQGQASQLTGRDRLANQFESIIVFAETKDSDKEEVKLLEHMVEDIEGSKLAGAKDVLEKVNHTLALHAINAVSHKVSYEDAAAQGIFISSDVIARLNGDAEGTPEICDNDDGLCVEGDMHAENETHLLLLRQASANGARWAGQLWPTQIPYCLHTKTADFADFEPAVLQAIAHIEDRSCVTFEEVPFLPDGGNGACDVPGEGIVFSTGNGCTSYVGKVSFGGLVSLKPTGCLEIGVVVHELLHALGQAHEQSRPDRDSHVTIFWQNIMQGMEHNFQKADGADDAVPYDYGSLMHYGATAFGIDGAVTISPIEGHDIGNRLGMSSADADQLARMYCGGEVPPTPVPTVPCVDKFDNCGDIAAAVGCGSDVTLGDGSAMVDTCPASCGHCPSASSPLSSDTPSSPAPSPTPQCVDKWHNCADLKADYGCTACCLSEGRSVEDDCPASCDTCSTA